MHVVVAVDGSESGQAIIQEITARSWPKEARFDVVHVLEPPHMWTLSATAEEAEHFSTTIMAEAVAALEQHGLVAEAVQKKGDPKSGLVHYASDVRASLIVVGSHGMSRAVGFLLGSVSSAVVRHAPCSVWVVRPRPAAPLGQKVLLATDGSEPSEAAARSIAKHPWPLGAEVRVLSVVEVALPAQTALFHPPGLPADRVKEIQAHAMSVAQDAVEAAVQIIRPSCADVSQSISVLLERPQKVILDEAEAWNADWIVVGSHGRRGVAHFLLGSVSEAVAAHARCSVEVVRPA